MQQIHTWFCHMRQTMPQPQVKIMTKVENSTTYIFFQMTKFLGKTVNGLNPGSHYSGNIIIQVSKVMNRPVIDSYWHFHNLCCNHSAVSEWVGLCMGNCRRPFCCMFLIKLSVLHANCCISKIFLHGNATSKLSATIK